MSVDGIGRAGGPQAAGKNKPKRRADGSFAGMVGGSESAGPSTATASSAPIAALDGLLSMQERDGESRGDQAARQHGEELLNLLARVRDGLLAGQMPADRLEALSRSVANRRALASDPRLASVLDDIRLRAEIELAKLEKLRQP